MFNSERAKAAGAPVEADISELAPGALQIVENDAPGDPIDGQMVDDEQKPLLAGGIE